MSKKIEGEMTDMLNDSDLSPGFGKLIVGKLASDVISMLGLSVEPCDIVMWEDRYQYIQKHKNDFQSEENFYSCVKKIPDVIADPDYIALHPTKNSIEYIKQIDELFIVAVRLKKTGNLAFRTAFPLTQKQLQDYIKSGTAKKMSKQS